MEVWAFQHQSLLIGPLSPLPASLAKKMSSSLTTSLDGYPSVAQVAVSKHYDLGVYKGYVKFSFPPNPQDARKLIEGACRDCDALYYTINDPFNYCEVIKFPCELDESLLDIGL